MESWRRSMERGGRNNGGPPTPRGCFSPLPVGADTWEGLHGLPSLASCAGSGPRGGQRCLPWSLIHLRTARWPQVPSSCPRAWPSLPCYLQVSEEGVPAPEPCEAIKVCAPTVSPVSPLTGPLVISGLGYLGIKRGGRVPPRRAASGR